MKSRLSLLSSAIGVFLFLLAIWTLHAQIRGNSAADFFRALEQIPTERILLAVLLTFLTYAMLTMYDVLGFVIIKKHLPYRSIALTSFVGYALGISLGFSALTSGSVRWRFYSSHGVSSVQVLQVIALASLTFWLGFCSVGAFFFLLFPPAPPQGLPFPFPVGRPLGVIALLLLASYLLWSALSHNRTIKIRQRIFSCPPFPLTLAQVLVGSTEWILAPTIAYVLLPHALHLPYAHFLGIFLIAQVSGTLSQVPGGLGVLETVTLALLPRGVHIPSILASLLVYRLLYNLLPLMLATAIMGTRELLPPLVRRHRRKTA